MKKILLTFILCLMTMLYTNAQVAIQTSKVTDNIYVGVGGGVMTPLDFNSVFPLNAAVKVNVGKNITPVLGFELEGNTLLNNNHFSGNIKTAFKSTYIGLNSTLNLSNMFGGYNGKPRWFEFRTNIGLGWIHKFDTPVDMQSNALGAKTGFDIVWNFGHARAVAIVISPTIYWNLNSVDGPINEIKFNKHYAQAAIIGSLVYNFKNSNGTRYFKAYNVGDMQSEISYLYKKLDEKPKDVIVEKVVEVEPAAPVTVEQVNPAVVFFAKGSINLTDDAKAILNKLSPELRYSVYGYASPEGAESFNMALSQFRANVVKDYLEGFGIKVIESKGMGTGYGDASNRVAIIVADK